MINAIVSSVNAVVHLLNALLQTIARYFGAVRHYSGLGASSSVTSFSVRLVVVLTMIVAFVGLWVVYAWPAISPISDQKKTIRFEEMHYRAQAISLWDSQERFFGFIPGNNEPDYLRLPYKNCYQIGSDNRQYCADHKTMWVEDAPEHFWDCLSFQEDRYAGAWRNPGGVDLGGYARIYTGTLAETLRSGRPDLGSGGSTLAMQLSRSLLKTPPGDPNVSVVSRKLTEWGNAPVLYNMLEAPDSKTWRRWNAMHLPLSTGSSGTLYGVEANALILFGKRADQLSIAEQYTLAAMAKFNPYRGDNSYSWRASTFGTDNPAFSSNPTGYDACTDGHDGLNYEIGRARVCARALLPPEQRAAVEEELLTLCQRDPNPRPHPDFFPILEDVADSLPETSGITPLRLASSPTRLSGALGSVSQRGILNELRDFTGPLPRKKVAEVQSTVDLTENYPFRRAVRKALEKLEANPATGLDGSYYSFTSAEDDKRLVPVTLAIADEQGRVLRYYENTNNTYFFGDNSQRDRSETFDDYGRFNRLKARREIASVSKILVGLAIAETGRDRPDQGYNNRCIKDRPQQCYCPSGRCGDSRDYVLARQAYAESLNDVLSRRIAALGLSNRINQLVRRSTLNPLEDVHGGTEVSTRAVRGWIGGTSRQVQAMTMAALDYSLGGTGQAQMPTLINAVRYYDPIGDTARWSSELDDLFEGTPALPREIDLKLAQSVAGRTYARSVLSAPACSRDGTLHPAMKDWCPNRRSDVELLIAKSGTRGEGGYNGNRPDNYEWWITGAISYDDGARYSFSLNIGTGTLSQAFSSETSAAAAPLAKLLLAEIDEIHAATRSGSAKGNP